MGSFPRNFSHIGVCEFTLETGTDKNKIIHDMVLLFNTNYLTAEEAMDLLEKNEYSDYMVAIPKSVFNGVFRDMGFSGSPCGIVS